MAYYADITSQPSMRGPKIRLLHLSPSDNREAGLRASLSVVDLKDQLVHNSALGFVELFTPPAFEALSYVWGRVVEAGGVELEYHAPGGDKTSTFVDITTNLADALKHLRLPDRTRLLWVDALCINQNDLGEKTAQVSIMSEIYRKADRVLVWMGPADNRSEWVLAHANNMFQQAEEPEQSRAVLTEAETFAYAQLLNREWYTRVWVVQELCVASDVIIICGDSSAPWDAIQASFKSLEGSSDSGQPSSLLNYGMTRHNSLCRLRALTSAGNHLGLSEALVRCQWSRATSHLDKVYALLGIAGDEGIIPDYRVSTEACFTNAARIILSRSTVPDLLDFVVAPASTKRNPLLPSWVPDWSPQNVTPRTEVAQTLADAYHLERILRSAETQFAPVGQGSWPRFHGTSTLILRAIELDTLVHLQSPIPGPWLGNTYSMDILSRPTDDLDAHQPPFAFFLSSWNYFLHNLKRLLTVSGKLLHYAATLAHLRSLSEFVTTTSSDGSSSQRSLPFERTLFQRDNNPIDRQIRLSRLCALLLSNSVGLHGLARHQPSLILHPVFSLTSRPGLEIYRTLNLHYLLPGVIYHGMIALTGVWPALRGQDDTFTRSIDAVSRLTPYVGMRVGVLKGRGFLGLVPHTAREGDSVVLVAGGRHPYIVRRRGVGVWVVWEWLNGVVAWLKGLMGMGGLKKGVLGVGRGFYEEGEGDRWMLVGPCYVSVDVMNELRKAWVEREVRELWIN